MYNEKFVKASYVKLPVEEVFNWYSKPGAIERLTPPWIYTKKVSRYSGIEQGSKAILKIKIASIPFEWRSRHVEYFKNKKFTDIQIKGPFQKWIHRHIFTSFGKKACKIEDKINFRLPLFPIGRIFNPIVRNKLDNIFHYRHTRIVKDLSLHLRYNKKMRILITGSSGFIGSNLIPFLTTGGHFVKKLVRRKPLSSNELFWNPNSDCIDIKSDEKFDVIIHLAGENIGTGLWTKEKRERILNSRINGTKLLVKTILRLNSKPKVFLSASATGYYGDRGERYLNEDSELGVGFLPKVCCKWEKAAENLIKNKIRTVFLRTGITLSPQDGILKRIILPFKLGFGGKIGEGNQYMSWICIDDLIRAIYHVMVKKEIKGPINIVSPNPVTNYEFSKILGKVLKRPTLFNLSKRIVTMIFGEMGKEILLSSTKVQPGKLLKSGFKFEYPYLEGAFRYLLGVNLKDK